MAKLLRPVGVVLTILGLYLLFAPIIAFLSFVPLAGMLLSSVASFAAFLFALIVGMTVSCLTIGIAWVFFRPMVGIPLLGLTGIGLYFIFFA